MPNNINAIYAPSVTPLFDVAAAVGTRQNFWMKLTGEKVEECGYRVVKIA